jgi:hypothetical protein
VAEGLAATDVNAVGTMDGGDAAGEAIGEVEGTGEFELQLNVIIIPLNIKMLAMSMNDFFTFLSPLDIYYSK